MIGRREASDWLRQVADMRVFSYDRIRQFLTRLALAAGIGASFVLLPGVTWWAWALLGFALLQGILEIALEPYVRVNDLQGQPLIVQALEPLRTWWSAVYERLPFNATGILGAAAVIANFAAVTFGTSANDATGWVKVAALACALLYANSGLSGPLLEATVYSDKAAGSVLRRLRPAVWVMGVLLAAGTVYVSDLAGRWPTSAVPYAMVACGLPYALGLRIREHDRLASAAGLLIKRSNQEASTRIGAELHRLVSPLLKGPLDRVLNLEGINPVDRVALRLFAEDIKHAREKTVHGIDLGERLLPDTETLVAQICAPGWIDPTVDIDLPVRQSGVQNAEHVVSDENAWFAKQLVATLAQNSVWAYQAAESLDRPLVVSAYLRAGEIVVSVIDALPPVPDEMWDRAEGTLSNFRRAVGERGGTLRQILLDGGGKAIEARWQNRLRPLLDTTTQED